MFSIILENFTINPGLLLTVIGLSGILLIIGRFLMSRGIGFISNYFLSSQVKDAYQKIVAPYQDWLGLVLILMGVDLTILLIRTPLWLEFLEIPLSLSVAVLITWLGSGLFKQFFDSYLLDIALRSKRKINSEFLITAKYLANLIIILIVFFIFAQTHQINLLGLIASLGVGGLAIAFAAQKILEQLLGGIVLFLDRPFVIDDYIGLPDGTFGRVETIGLRSTKIRTSGKGTLIIVPNSSIIQTNIENYTEARKIISFIKINFRSLIPEEEKALIRQIIIDSTKEIFGLDPQNTEVDFKNYSLDNQQQITQANVYFFILGSEDVSLELRRQLLDIAKQNITQQLKEYGISFELQEQTTNIEAPITI